MPDPFENEKLSDHEILRDMHRYLTGPMDERLKSIEVQAKMTNGRTSALETWKAEMVAKEREAQAYNAGASSRIPLTKKQVTAIMSGLGVLVAAGSGIGTVIARAL